MTSALWTPVQRTRPPEPVVHVEGDLEIMGTFVKRLAADAKPGSTLAEMLVGLAGKAAEFAVVHIVSPSGMVYGPIPREWWSRVRPQLGRRVVVHLVPQGGDERKERFWISIAIALVASLVTWGVGSYLSSLGYSAGTASLWGSVAGSAVSIGGAMLMQSLLPVAAQKLPGLSGQRRNESTSNTLSITGSQNRASLYGAIPVVYGQHARWPAWC